ncbi:MAG: hypothetical protein WA252_04440 [Candidatus Sulfotelmatobacter sp.]
MAKGFADIVRRRHRSSPFGDPSDFNGRLADWVRQSHRDEVEAQHAHERIEQGVENLGWIAATPDSGKSKQAHKVVNAPLQALDFAGSKFGLDFHV